MKKDETMRHWDALPADQPILEHMAAIPYKPSGSTYGTCGIRIDGNPEFIDAVLSHLKELIQGEGVSTRLGLAYSKVDGSGINKSLPNAETDAHCCYIRLHERGHEGKIVQAIMQGARERQLA